MGKKRNTDEPPCKEAQKCIKIRKKRKQDIAIGLEADIYCMKILKRYPSWYKKMEERIFETFTRVYK